MFGYLAEFEAQGDKPNDASILRTTLFAIALFFSHGITFAVALIIAGLSWVLRRGWLERWRAAVHVVPLLIITCVWLVLHRGHSSAPASEWFDSKRAIVMFSGCFTPYANKPWAAVGAGGVLLFLVLARPKFDFGLVRVLPLIVSVAGFMLLPDWLASTWLVASRFCVFVHAFAPAVLRPRETDAIARQWRWLLLALVVGFLGLLIVRLRAFNQELAGFEEIAALIPPGADVQTRVPETDSTSAAFGEVELGQVPAWITAERGGLIANDSAVSGYFQLPVRRKNIPLLQDYPYVIARGNPHRYRNALPTLTRSAQGPAQLLKQSGDWLLYKRQPIENADFSVVRYLQGWGDLRVDREVEGHPLNIAGVPYQHGLGTHAKSLIRIRLKRSAQHFTGACGMDRMAGTRGHGAFRVRDSNGQTLYESGPLGAESPAKAFAVPVSGQTELYLEVDPVETYLNAHADWVNLELN